MPASDEEQSQGTDFTSIRRVYVEKKEGFDIEARGLQGELAEFLGGQYPALKRLEGFRILHRYDAGRLSKEQFEKVVDLVLSEPQCDLVYYGGLPADKRGEEPFSFAVEYMPGQYDQRADSAEQCAELVTGIKPAVRSARVYVLKPGAEGLPAEALEAVKRYLINSVDSREAPLYALPDLEASSAEPKDVPLLEGFRDAADPGKLAECCGLAMSGEDLALCRSYFIREGRDPTMAELRVLDTYWSDHCRHTTFTTALEHIAVSPGPLASSLRKALDRYEDARREVYGGGAEMRKRTLMDMATIGAKVLKKRGLLPDLDESKEINACSVRVKAEFSDGSTEPWLLLFKNETHNHPTEIEPFGGAATCLGGAIRDPLAGRAYVHQAMRVTGGGDPRAALQDTLPGKLSQLRLARGAAAGYSSYGNQIGLATGQVAEFYHPGFLAKRMELGAVIGAVPEIQVRREEPLPGDLVILVGGKTGRDGIGGATGSSKIHTGESVENAGAEVQKGNAVEERKLQRLFRNPGFTRLIKRCNDFGAGGVSVAVGELAAGLEIDLDKVPKKYAGLNGVELAISESQERMAIVCAAADAEALIGYAAAENLGAVVIAGVNAGDDDAAGARLRMKWRGKTIVDLSRAFLNSNGAPRSASAAVSAVFAGSGGPAVPPGAAQTKPGPAVLLDQLKRELGSLRSGSRRGLQERFDGSIGALSVLFPWGGREQGTPECGMAALLPSLEKESRTASLMSFGCDPVLMSRNPYDGAKGSIREALAKFACLGGNPWNARLSLQEYFEQPRTPESWGRPAAALLGALEAQLALGIPAIGGKDSMSGNYRDDAAGIHITVPPTLAAFAAGTVPVREVRSGALCGRAGNSIILLKNGGGDEWETFRANMNALAALSGAGLVCSAYPAGPGGTAVALALMAFGNMTGIELYAPALDIPGSATEIPDGAYQGSVLAELAGDLETLLAEGAEACLRGASWFHAARTVEEPVCRIRADFPAGEGSGDLAEISLEELRRAYEAPLAGVYPQTAAGHTVAETPKTGEVLSVLYKDRSGKKFFDHGLTGQSNSADRPDGSRSLPHARRITGDPHGGNLVQNIMAVKFTFAKTPPLVVLPVFPGTNCEWDMERAFREAGAGTRLVVFRNRDRQDILESTGELARAIGEAQILALSGGFSAGDEPDGSGKFIANVFRSPAVAAAVTELLEKRDGLMIGICNGFQALIKLGLVPYGSYRDADSSMPTLTYNRIGRHVSRMVRTRVMSVSSPWLSLDALGTIHTLPISHGEGRVAVRGEEAEALFLAGQVPFCYVDKDGEPVMAEPDNPNGSDFAIEGLTSPDGRILGKMGHSERRGEYVHINIPGSKRQGIFEAGVAYFR
ncbi:MAG: phosphoribosylformylglycinamidine synthase [Treponema sp.]|jgi:phosphoribosylformylglycinamidine synthase|nr:phosphoribosylformylglycinamidine synthase [Treponema sp.]